MAKQNLKVEYKRQRRRIQSFMRKAEKRGYIFDYNLPAIPKKITQASIRRLSKVTPDYLYKHSTYVNQETGELVSGVRGRDIERLRASRKAAATKRANQKSSQQFWTQPSQEDYIPDGGDIILYNTMTEVVGRIPSVSGDAVEMILERLRQDPEEQIVDFFGKRRARNKNIMQAIRIEKDRLIDLINQRINEIGTSKLGWQIEEHIDELEMAIQGLFYSSSSNEVHVAAETIARIIKGSPLTEEEREDFAEYAEQFESWSEEQ